MSNSERKFWEDMLALSNPEWKLELADEAPLGELSAADVGMYVVYTRNSTILGSVIAEADWHLMMKDARSCGRTEAELTESAVGTIAAILKRGEPKASAEEVKLIVKAALVAMGFTQTFAAVVRQQSTLVGTWLYVVYEGKRGGFGGRPAFIPGRPQPLPTPAEIREFLKEIIATDRKPGTAIDKILGPFGGIRID